MSEFYEIIMSTYNAARNQNSFSVLQFCNPDIMVTYLTFEILFQGLQMLQVLSPLKHGYKGYQCYHPYLLWNRVTRVKHLTNPISSETGLKGFTNVTKYISSETGLQLTRGYECYQPYLFWNRVTKITEVTSFISLSKHRQWGLQTI